MDAIVNNPKHGVEHYQSSSQAAFCDPVPSVLHWCHAEVQRAVCC